MMILLSCLDLLRLASAEALCLRYRMLVGSRAMPHIKAGQIVYGTDLDLHELAVKSSADAWPCYVVVAYTYGPKFLVPTSDVVRILDA